jgi:UDP-glucose 4-epimerase
MIRGGERIELVQLPNLACRVEWDSLVADVDIVIHLAAIAHRQACDVRAYDQTNRGSVVSLADACKRHSTQRLIFLSSIGAQTGSAADKIITENDEPQPVTDYDRAKLAAEAAILQSGVFHTILRPVIVYGPNPKANMALMLRIAAMPWPLPFGAFRNQRSLLSIDNLIQAIFVCLDGSATLNETFVVADPGWISLAGMFSCLRIGLGQPRNLFPIPPAVFKALLKLAGREMFWDRIGRDLMVRSSKLQNVGWTPSVRTEDGLQAMARASIR